MSAPRVPEFSQLPSIDLLLESAELAGLIALYGRDEVKRVARETLQSMRAAIKRGGSIASPLDAIFAAIEASCTRDSRRRLRRVFNLTGTILHTNLGRAAMPQASIEAVAEVMAGASNLEYDLESGGRGDRDAYLEDQLCRLTGAEAATVINNNAAAVMLLLNTLALGKEVPVSRGELVEIGGSFRIPDIMARSGCQLVEVGATNRTHLQDFSAALGPQTALIMKVHQSNYVIQGFTAAVGEHELARLCSASGIPFVVDLGSGTLVNLEQYGLPHEPTPMDALQAGADIVTFSGDKLLGGPQAGIIVGRRDLVDAINANPMKRALRCDKMTIAALSALLSIYNHPQKLPDALPMLRLMTRGCDEIRSLAIPISLLLKQRMAGIATVRVVDCDSEIGSGALPGRSIPSVGVSLRPESSAGDTDQQLHNFAAALRQLPVPVIGRIRKGELLLDCRCLEQLDEFTAQLSELRISA